MSLVLVGHGWVSSAGRMCTKVDRCCPSLEIIFKLYTDQIPYLAHTFFSHTLTPTNLSLSRPCLLTFEIFANTLKGILARLSSSSSATSVICAVLSCAAWAGEGESGQRSAEALCPLSPNAGWCNCYGFHSHEKINVSYRRGVWYIAQNMKKHGFSVLEESWLEMKPLFSELTSMDSLNTGKHSSQTYTS